MTSWLDKAKEAANMAAVEAKKLAETAKNANYGEMFDKTKQMAMQAAEEAKKAAATVSAAVKKEDKAGEAGAASSETSTVTAVASTTVAPTVDAAKVAECKARLDKIEAELKEIREMLR